MQDMDKRTYHLAYSLLVFSHLLAEGWVKPKSIDYALQAYRGADER
jgi:hypothetical protein